jgi:hypothetical protein
MNTRAGPIGFVLLIVASNWEMAFSSRPMFAC